MNETKTRKSEILNIIFAILLFGGLWGIVEATLGTLLHLIPHGMRLIFWSSTTVLLPIAYFLMGACYRKTGKIRSVLYMGVFASIIKIISAAIFASKYEPALYMLMEAACMSGALLVIRPKQMISFAGLATGILASTLYLGLSTFVRINVATATSQQVLENITKYMFTYNCVAILYMFVGGAIIFGLMKLAEAKEWKFSKVKDVIFHPAFASSIAVVAVAVTLILH